MDAKDLIIQQLTEKLLRLEQIVAEQSVRIAELEKRLEAVQNLARL